MHDHSYIHAKKAMMVLKAYDKKKLSLKVYTLLATQTVLGCYADRSRLNCDMHVLCMQNLDLYET